MTLTIIGISFTGGLLVNKEINKNERDKEAILQQQFEEYEKSQTIGYVYPQEKDEELRGISVSYTSDILSKKSKNQILTQEEEELILEFALQENGKGIAYTRFIEFDAGMGKATRRLWETSNYGKNWNVLDEEQYSFGYYDITYIENTFIENVFESTAQKGYFKISYDGGHTFEKTIPVEDVFQYDGIAYPKKVCENAEKGTVSYQWVDFYSTKEIDTVEYDLDLIPVK